MRSPWLRQGQPSLQHTIRICSAERKFPKRYRWAIANKIVETAIDISKHVKMANNLNVNVTAEAMERRVLQTKALEETYALLNLIDIAYETFKLDGDSVANWTEKVYELQMKIRNWRKSDSQRVQ